MSDTQRGVLAILAACTLWGLSGIYFDAISHVPPLEILAHRVVWSVVFFLVLFTLQRRLRAFGAVLANPRYLAVLTGTTLLVSVNWFGYIWAVQNGHATEASLGYYIFPLMAVALGWLVFRERFSPLQRLAIALAVAAVAILTAGLGTPPWIAILLAGTFAVYGVIKKTVDVGPVRSVAAEVTVALPVALVWLGAVHMTGAASFGADLRASWLLPLSAAFTGVPLVLFAYAARRLDYSTLGVIQYLNPTLQFLVAVLYLGEPFGWLRAGAFALIWTGVALYCSDIWRASRASDRAASSASGVSKTRR